MVTLFALLFLVIFAKCEEDVRYAAIIYRHGDRTPVQPYPTDPWKDECHWPVKFGELTNEGKRQHFALGQWLRKRYARLLSARFSPAEIYVRSTDVDRTLMSAQANLAGMYPPEGKDIWMEGMQWQPVPVHTVPERDDEVLAMLRKCLAYDTELVRIKRSWEYKNKLSQFEDLMSYLSTHTGLKVKDYDDIMDIYSTLFIEKLYNFALPNWTDLIFPDKMREPACYSFVTPTYNPDLARIKAGPLIKEIVTAMSYIVSNETAGTNRTQRRVAIYSGHDYTIANVLNSMHLFDQKCPVYTATIFMELLKVDGQYIVRVSYRNTTEIVEPHVLSLPRCGKNCTIQAFKELYRGLLSINWEFECVVRCNLWLYEMRLPDIDIRALRDALNHLLFFICINLLLAKIYFQTRFGKTPF